MYYPLFPRLGFFFFTLDAGNQDISELYHVFFPPLLYSSPSFPSKKYLLAFRERVVSTKAKFSLDLFIIQIIDYFK